MSSLGTEQISQPFPAPCWDQRITLSKSHMSFSAGNSLAVQFSQKFSVLLIYLIHHQSISKTFFAGTSQVVRWLRFHTPNAGVPGLIPSRETRSCMPQLKILCAAAKTQCSQMILRRFSHFHIQPPLT